MHFRLARHQDPVHLRTQKLHVQGVLISQYPFCAECVKVRAQCCEMLVESTINIEVPSRLGARPKDIERPDSAGMTSRSRFLR